MKRLVAGALVIVVAALWFNRGFIAWPDFDHLAMSDHAAIVAGYYRIHSFGDTAAWWHGPSIHTQAEALRPLSSYLLWLQADIGLSFGWLWASWLAFALFALNCLLTAALAWRLTRSYAAALVAGLLFSNIGYWLPGWTIEGGSQKPWLLWWLVSDNLLDLAFYQASLIMFLRWRETGRRRHLAGVWACFVASCLAKEMGFVLPALFMVLSMLTAATVRKRAMLQVLMMGTVSIAFYAYRSAVLPHPHNPPASYPVLLEGLYASWLSMVSDFAIRSGLLVTVAATVVLCLMIAGVWRLIGDKWPMVVALWLCVQLSYLPVMGFGLNSHYGLWGAMLQCVLWSVMAQAAVETMARRLNLHQIIEVRHFTVTQRPAMDGASGKRAV